MKIHKNLADWNWFARNKSYLLFSLAVGLASVLVGAIVGIVTSGLLLTLLTVALVIAVATGWRYREIKRLFGPIATVSAIYTIIVLVVGGVAVKEFGLVGAPFSSTTLLYWMIAGSPIMFAMYVALLFVPSVVAFLLVRSYGVWLKELLLNDKAYTLFSLAAGVASITAAVATFMLTKDDWNPFFVVFATVFAAAAITSVMTAARYSRVKKLMGPVIAASLVSTAAFGFMSFKFGQSLFGYVTTQEEEMRLLLIELPLIFAALILVGFVLSALIYAVTKVMLRKSGRKQAEK